MARTFCRRYMSGLSELQAKILLIRGFITEENLLYQKQFADILRKPLTTINYNIQVLRTRNLITTSNFLTPDGKVVFQKIKGYLQSTKKLRGHKMFGGFTLTQDFADFENVRDQYLRISKSPKHRGFRVEFKDCIVLFYSPRKACFYLPDVYGDSIEELYTVAFDEYIKPLQSYLEQIFPGLRIDQHKICNVTINHLSLQFHPLAELFQKLNVRYASDRLEVDHSHSVPELETVHKESSVQDMDKIMEYEKLIRGSDFRNNYD